MKYCCEMMKNHIYIKGDFDEETHKIQYSPTVREYGLAVDSNLDSIYLINYCPWCGKKLPESLRDKWFEELENLGFEDPLFRDDIPEEYKSDKWWNKNND